MDMTLEFASLTPTYILYILSGVADGHRHESENSFFYPR